MEQEATTPTPQTLPDIIRYYITYDRTQVTAIIEPSPVTKKPATPPTTPDSPPMRRSRLNSLPEPTRDPSEPPVEICYDVISQLFPLHEKYDHIYVYNPTFEEFEVVKARTPSSRRNSTWTYQSSSCFIWKTGTTSRDQLQNNTMKNTTQRSRRK